MPIISEWDWIELNKYLLTAFKEEILSFCIRFDSEVALMGEEGHQKRQE